MPLLFLTLTWYETLDQTQESLFIQAFQNNMFSDLTTRKVSLNINYNTSLTIKKLYYSINWTSESSSQTAIIYDFLFLLTMQRLIIKACHEKNKKELNLSLNYSRYTLLYILFMLLSFWVLYLHGVLNRFRNLFDSFQSSPYWSSSSLSKGTENSKL